LLAANVAVLRAQNPDWTYKYYDDAMVALYIRNHFGDAVNRCYDRINPAYGAARADFFRYLLMYREGGVYLDIKSTVQRPLSEIILKDDVYWISQWDNGAGRPYEGWGLNPLLADVPGGEYQQWYIVAAPRHPFLREVIKHVMTMIDCYQPRLHGVGKIGVLNVTGPISYTLSIAPIRKRYRHREVASDAMGLRYTMFDDHRPFSHLKFFPNHYIGLREPVVNARA